MKNREHRKKMLAPVVITVVFILYLIGYGIALAVATEWSPVMLLIAIPLVALGIGMVYTLKQSADGNRRRWAWSKAARFRP